MEHRASVSELVRDPSVPAQYLRDAPLARLLVEPPKDERSSLDLLRDGAELQQALVRLEKAQERAVERESGDDQSELTVHGAGTDGEDGVQRRLAEQLHRRFAAVEDRRDKGLAKVHCGENLTLRSATRIRRCSSGTRYSRGCLESDSDTPNSDNF